MIVAFVFSITFVTNAWALEQDKLFHIGSSAALTLMAYHAMPSECSRKKRLVAAILLTTVLGVGKELTDPKFDPNDIIANMAGMGIVVPFLWRF